MRPFLGLVLLLGLRQIMQALCALPAPPNMIWHYPGFPSLLVTYNVGNDFFFSGHTAIAVFGGIELALLGKRWLKYVAVAIALFEIAAVLVLRAHYTMDVFTGLLAAIVVAQFCAKVSPRIDAWLSPGYLGSANANQRLLFITKRHDGIDPHCAPCGNITRRERHDREQRRH